MDIIYKNGLKIFKNEVARQYCSNILGKAHLYKSAFSLENLYPKSNLKIYTPTFVPEDSSAKFNGYIPIDKLNITYSNSSGPGGQHVNKVKTKVDLRFNVNNATWLAEDIRKKLQEQHKTKITKEGYLVIRSEVTRSQQLNLADALEKLRAMIRKALEPEPEISEETKEMLRKRQLRHARRRLFEKRMRSYVKRDRQTTIDDY